MIEQVIIFIQTHLLPLGGLGVLLAAFLEEVIAPIPSALVIMGAGFLFVSGPLDTATIIKLASIVVLPASIGITVGSLFVYAIAYYAGKPFLLKWGKWLGLSWFHIEKLQDKFKESSFDDWALVAARSIPVLPSVAISAFCGLVRFPLRTYLLCSFLGTVIRASILGFIGWRVGALYFQYSSLVSAYENIVLWTIVALVIVFIGWGIYRSRPKV